MAGRYAADTKVSSAKSRAEIEKTLRRYGATAFGYGWEGSRAIVTFKAHDRMVRFELAMPELDDEDIAYTPTGLYRSEGSQEQALEQAHRQRWRALALVIKAKLEAVESGLLTFEEEFLSHLLLPDGQTAGQFTIPQIATAYETGDMPSALPGVRPQLTRGD